MKFFLAVVFFSAVSATSIFSGDEWKEVKSPLDSPRYQEILKGLFPPVVAGRILRGGRIAGGELAKLGQFKHQALLLNVDKLGDNYVCGGSIISHNWILTAAHCLDNIVKISVYVGILDRVNGPAVWGIDITDKSNMITHENYVANGIVNDIALLKLVNTIKNDPNVGIVSLPSKSEVNVVLDYKLATIAGFGKTSDTAGPSQFLRYINANIVPNSVCEKVFGVANVRATNVCLEGTQGRSSCPGDSGGGLTVDLNGRKVVVGVVSFGALAGCTLNYPAVYTRVTSYLDWISSKTGIVIQ